VQAILVSPTAEWDKIDVEPATTHSLFTGYVCILAAIPALASMIGVLVFGYGGFGFTFRPAIGGVIAGGVVQYVLSLVSVFVLALVIDALAPSFDGTKNQIQAMKVAAYSGTAGWVAGIFGLYPPLGILATLGGLYGLYILYLGLPKLMKAPHEKALGYTVVTIVVAIVLFLVVGGIGGAVVGAAGGLSHIGGPGYTSNDAGTVSGTVNIGGAKVDLGKLQQASKEMEAAAGALQAQQNGQPAPAGSVKAVPADTLKGLLPAALPAGFARTESEASSGGVGGVGASSAQGVYARGDQKITLQVADMAAMGALAALGNAVDLQQDQETTTGYKKLGKVDGRMTTEEFDRQTKTGEYSVVVANRFVVKASGEGADMGDLKGAVGQIGFDRLEGLARS
jgi:hypothetical protein